MDQPFRKYYVIAHWRDEVWKVVWLSTKGQGEDSVHHELRVRTAPAPVANEACLENIASRISEEIPVPVDAVILLWDGMEVSEEFTAMSMSFRPVSLISTEMANRIVFDREVRVNGALASHVVPRRDPRRHSRLRSSLLN